ncbi:hypothetical protein DH2020_044800 [Rehmannia glutinosa]|uniref:Uncharacterized protein n=1 Tax=Rehmannia glutinosa TaxID=99300 RepID=A0ABR0UGK9_REHGL
MNSPTNPIDIPHISKPQTYLTQPFPLDTKVKARVSGDGKTARLGEESSGENDVPSPTSKRRKMNRKGKAKVISTTQDDNHERSIRSRRDDATWDMATIASFLELMYIQFQEGQLLTSTFSDQTWKTIGKELFDRHNENSEEARLRKKGLPHYDCTEMFSKSVATGAFARSSAFGPLDYDEEGDLNPTYKVTTQIQGIPLGVGTLILLDLLQEPSSLYKASDKKTTKSTRSSRLDEAIDAWTSRE